MKRDRRSEQRRYRESALRVLRTLVLSLAVICGLVFFVDPLQHYRQASFYTPMFDYHRYLNPGVARNYEYDTAIIGTSMTENFVLSEIESSLGMEAVNLSLPGASLAEEMAVLDVALRSGRLRNVLFSLDLHLLGEKDFSFRLENFPLYLYDESPWNDYKYLLDMMSLKMLLYVFAGNTWEYRQNKFIPDRAFNWGSPGDFNRANAIRGFLLGFRRQELAAKGRPEVDAGRGGDLSRTYSHNFERHILSLVRENPDVDFILFYPPYSSLYWQLASPAVWERVLEFKRYTFESTSGLDNVRIYDFQAEREIVTDLDNYKDYSHFSPEINRHIINSIAAGRHMLTQQNIENQLERLRVIMHSVDRNELLSEASGY